MEGRKRGPKPQDPLILTEARLSEAYRLNEIFDLRAENLSLGQIGNRLGLTRERIRQHVNDLSASNLSEATRERLTENVATRKQAEFRAEVRSYALQRLARSQIATKLKVSESSVDNAICGLKRSAIARGDLKEVSLLTDRRKLSPDSIALATLLNHIFDLRMKDYTLPQIGVGVQRHLSVVRHHIRTLCASVSPTTALTILRRRGHRAKRTDTLEPVRELTRLGYPPQIIAQSLKISERQVQARLKKEQDEIAHEASEELRKSQRLPINVLYAAGKRMNKIFELRLLGLGQKAIAETLNTDLATVNRELRSLRRFANLSEETKTRLAQTGCAKQRATPAAKALIEKIQNERAQIIDAAEQPRI